MSSWEERMSQRAQVRIARAYAMAERESHREDRRRETAYLIEHADDIWQVYKAGPSCAVCYVWMMYRSPWDPYDSGHLHYQWQHVVIGEYDDPDEDCLCHHDCHDEPYYTKLPALA